MKFKLLLTFSTVLILACNTQKEMDDHLEWQLIYQNNDKGEAIKGSKEELIGIVREGYPIRVGWSSKRKSDTTKTVEHIVDGEFLTIANKEEVFAQITPFMAQRPDLTSDTLNMTLLPIQSHWILGTNGTISSVGVNFAKDTVNSYPPSTFRYDISWFARVPNRSEP